MYINMYILVSYEDLETILSVIVIVIYSNIVYLNYDAVKFE